MKDAPTCNFTCNIPVARDIRWAHKNSHVGYTVSLCGIETRDLSHCMCVAGQDTL